MSWWAIGMLYIFVGSLTTSIYAFWEGVNGKADADQGWLYVFVLIFWPVALPASFGYLSSDVGRKIHASREQRKKDMAELEKEL